MRIENTFTVAAPAEAAWDLLMDVPRVIPCMPGATLDGIPDLHPLLPQLVEVRDEHDSVQHGDAEQGDESDAGGHRQVLTGDKQRRQAAHQRQRDVEEDEHRLLDGVERGEQHPEDQQ